MPEITNMQDYSFKFSDVVGDYLSKDTVDIKDRLDRQPKEVREFVVGLVNLLNSVNGADYISAKGYDGLKTTIQAMLNDLNNRKVDQDGNFKGTWNGMEMHLTNEGLATDWNAAKGVYNSVNERLNDTDIHLENIDLSLYEKANQVDLETEKTRIDNLVANAGDVSNNAELLDIRVGTNGYNDTTAGNAVRNLRNYVIGDGYIPIYKQTITSSNTYVSNLLEYGKKYKIKIVPTSATVTVSLSMDNPITNNYRYHEIVTNIGTEIECEFTAISDCPYIFMYKNGTSATITISKKNENFDLKDSEKSLYECLLGDDYLQIYKGYSPFRHTNFKDILIAGNTYKVSVFGIPTGGQCSITVNSTFPFTNANYLPIALNFTADGEYEFTATESYTHLHVYQTKYNNTDTILITISEKIPLNSQQDIIAGKKYACFGDSILSDQVTGIGTLVSNLLGCEMVGNFAVGYATCSDWHDSATNTTTVTLTEPQNTNTNDNVLSNQVRRILQHTTALGSQIAWTHPVDGSFTLNTSVGTGLGNTAEIPDIIYIAISTNDGNTAYTPVIDDTDTVFGQTYSQLTRQSIASALRWAIETLQSAYPNAQIFIASPLQTGNNTLSWFSYTTEKLKRDIIQKVCQFCSVHFVDSFNESGFSAMIAKTNGESGSTVHPNVTWKNRIAKFVANEILKRQLNI